jgi:uncharacterized membrane protein
LVKKEAKKFHPPTYPKPSHEAKRLHFIDAMRAFAILMMLQGHFIGLSLKDFNLLASLKNSTGTSGSLLFDGWHFMKGLTAPLFFFITGLVFVFFLLQSHHSEKQNPRVQKGVIRGFELIFWGYLLQLNLRYIKHTFYNETPFLYAFHVLQCIGASLLLLIGLYLLYKTVKKVPLSCYFLLAGISIFGFCTTLNTLEAFPYKGPQLLQNIFKGPYSIFPMIPWADYVMFGGFFGVLIHTFKKKLNSIPISITLLAIALDLKFITYLSEAISHYNKLADVLLVTFIFIQLEGWFSKRWNLFLSVGKKTLFVYLRHSILLYGGIVGFGLNNLIKRQLSAAQAIFGAMLFLIVFVYFSKLSPFFDALKAKVFKFLKLPGH